jgi:hypothetical protein
VSSQIQIMVYDPLWPEVFQRETDRIRTLLGCRALHLLVVADSSDEPAYVPILERASYSLRIREPNWHTLRVTAGVSIGERKTFDVSLPRIPIKHSGVFRGRRMTCGSAASSPWRHLACPPERATATPIVYRRRVRIVLA